MSWAFLIPLALLLGIATLGAFFWSVRDGQYDDLDGAAARILLDDNGDRIGAAAAVPEALARKDNST